MMNWQRKVMKTATTSLPPPLKRNQPQELRFQKLPKSRDGDKFCTRRSAAALSNPLCWGVIDLREGRVSPCSNHPRAKSLIPAAELNKVKQFVAGIVEKESHLGSSALALPESDVISLHKFGDEMRIHGLSGICALLYRGDDIFNNQAGQYIQKISQALMDALNKSDFDTASKLHAQLGQKLQLPMKMTRRGVSSEAAIKN